MTMRTLTQRLAHGGGPRRQMAAAAAAIVAVVIVIAVIISAGAPGSSKGQSSAAAATGATTVQRRDLVETDTESGTLGYANAQTVYNRLSGTITYLPNVGQVVKPGGTLYQVDGYPVILFNGSYPAYRDLTAGDSNGPDIEELNADLKAMGFDPDNAITVDQTWQDATTDAVERFQGSIGQTETGTISLGQIVFLPGSQLVNAVDSTLGSTGGSGGAGSGSSADSSDSDDSSDSSANSSDPTSTATPADYQVPGQAHAEFVGLTTSSTAAANSTPAATPAVTTPACPTNPTTTTTTTPATGCPPVGTPTTTTPAPTTTTPTTTAPGTSSLSGTPSSSALEAIVKLLQTQNKLLQSELQSAKASSGATGTEKGSTGTSSGSSSARSGGGGGSTASAGAASSGSGSSGDSSSGASSSGASSAGASATAILSTTSTSLVVTVDLDATKQSEAVLNEPVTVELPDGSTVNGKITGVSSVATSTSSGSSSSTPSASAPSATIPVTVALEKHTDTRGLDQAAVSVNFEEQVANNVLSVPVTALLATQGGGYAVQEAAAPHKLVPVTPGLFAAGYVQISGPDVQDGMQVTDSQG
jgi:hypothetical protein